MRKINKILIGLILVATMFLGIGYSAIQNITLDIQGTATANATIYTAKTLPAKAYGGYVSNYVPTNGSSVGWRIFHSDGIKNKWLKQYIESGYAGTTYNMGATSYLLDTSLWTDFKDSKGFAQYAVGAPTLELFAESYNRTHPNNIIETQIENEKGYQIKWSEDDSYSYSVSNLDTSNNLYVITDTTKARAYWIASPSSGNLYNNDWGIERNIFNVRYNMLLRNEVSDTYTRGSRPIIALDSSVEVHWQGDDQYLIVK